MHLLAVGGGGALGRAALDRIRQLPAVARITVADYDGAAAAAVAADLGARAAPLTLDICDAAALEAAVASADVVLNTSGPYFRYGLIVLKAALAAGRPYLDACDDPEATLGMLVLDRQARAAGVPALIGLGASPGVTNLLAVAALEALDDTRRLATAWRADGRLSDADNRGPRDTATALDLHRVQQASGQVSVYRHGARELAEALAPVKLSLPGYGSRVFYQFGHPEAVTLGRRYPALADAPSLVALTASQHHGWQALMRSNTGAEDEVDRLAGLLAAGAFPGPGLGRRLRRFTGGMAPPTAVPELFALAEGQRAGRNAVALAELTTVPAGTYAGLAGSVLALGVQAIVDRRLPEPGIFTPESVFVPAVFFPALAALASPDNPESDLLKITVT